MTGRAPVDAMDPEIQSSEILGKKRERALLMKIDLRLIPFLSFVYLLSFLDRANIGNAKIEGLAEDLKMTDQEYLWTLTAFFFPYSFFKTPSNILLKRLKPRIWFPAIIIAWGTCMTLMGFVKNFEGLLICRLFLGTAEAGLFPGVTYYLSCWYKRNEYGIRAAIFFSAATLSGAFGGLLAAAIAKMDGIGQLPGWAWIFIIEGAVTVLAGIAAIWLIHDFPDTAKFLTPDERALTIARLQSDSQRSAGRNESFRLNHLWVSCKDWKTGVSMIIYMGIDGALYAFALFLPTIIKELGFTSTRAQLLSVPPYVLACLVTVGVGFAADRSGNRGKFNMLCLPLALVGYIMNIVPSSGPRVRYAGMFLAGAGIYPCISNTMSWVSNNFEGSYKKAIVMALVVSWGNIQGAATSNVYRAEDAPKYVLGHGVVMAYLVVGLVGSVVFSVLLRVENQKRDRGERKSRIKTGTEEEADELGDQHPDFRYKT